MAVQPDWAAIVWAVTWPPSLAVICAIMRHAMRRPPSATDFWENWGIGAGGCIIGAVMSWDLLDLAVAGGQAVLAVIMWWLSRRRKRRAPKVAGARARAIIAAMARTMRERSRPRPVLRPQRQGA